MFPVYSLTIWGWRLSLSLWPGRILSDNFKSDNLLKSDEILCPTWEYDRWSTWRDLYVPSFDQSLKRTKSMSCFSWWQNIPSCMNFSEQNYIIGADWDVIRSQFQSKHINDSICLLRICPGNVNTMSHYYKSKIICHITLVDW